ncbi:small ribosomal subunit biogenesis GTPase RsgA [Kangiella sediminilitoris]|uniref:Small ribosomal subunit biogenesis GTPase RsgA n=1 Tax=Kangiella sediminilitoris TaxID=1144748 RepID=A0A1B3BCZ0_9GAMM|nr:small ribosomal subunit biogenesis GTPase RsgA [Kangiella sediminilitoris]AOE50628.1 Putative ribosome biogenesis GTPase RsgA [Kangiella sediminilitoris]
MGKKHKRKAPTRKKRQSNLSGDNQQTSQELNSEVPEMQDLGPAEEGIVISRFGQQVDIADQNFETIRCFLRRSNEVPVVGDRAKFKRQDKLKTGVLVELEERKSLLKRPTPHHGIKPVAANIDLIALLLAPELGFSEMLLDRYLVAAESSGIPVWLIFNKWDLLDEQEKSEIENRLQTYKEIGYPIYFISAKHGDQVDQLVEDLRGKQLLLAGQSGVGKSTLIKYLFPGLEVSTADISETSGLGTHTTTASRLYKLDEETFLVDSPGVREFGLWHLEDSDIQQGFVEIYKLAENCKFRNCKHIKEPGCAVLAAAEKGEIAESRMKNYHHLIQHYDQQFS